MTIFVLHLFQWPVVNLPLLFKNFKLFPETLSLWQTVLKKRLICDLHEMR